MIRELVKLGHGVTLYPLVTPLLAGEDAHAELPEEVEVAVGGATGFPAFWGKRQPTFDLVFVSRPHNKQTVNEVVRRGDPEHQPRIVYDAEAVFCLRDLGLLRRQKQDPPPRYKRRAMAREMALVEPSVAVLAVSAREREVFAHHCGQPVAVVGHALEPAPTDRPLSLRRTLLFVGSMSDRWCPNVDAAGWLLKEIFPLVAQGLGDEARLVIVGSNVEQHIRAGDDAVKVVGQAADLSPYYDEARVFVAPARYGAGIPIKIYEAASRGVPVVTTSLLAEQLGWEGEVDLLVADEAPSLAAQCVRLCTDPSLWHRLRDNALARVTSECSPQRFRTTLSQVVDDACCGVRRL